MNNNNLSTNYKKTFINLDLMDLYGFANDLYKILQIDNLLNDNSVVVSLNAKFGMGKSYFLEMFENYLRDEKKSKVILINSWKNDFCNDPLVAICCELILYFEKQNNENSLPILEQLKAVISIFGDLLNEFTRSEFGIDVKENIKKNKNQFYGNLIFDQFKQKRELFEKLYQSIAKYTKEKQLIILVDELDRTRPDYAINFLETLKHFFDIKGLTFILAVNKEQLKHSVECIYGKIDFDEYYRKFAQRDIDLPYNENGINKFINKRVDDFFQKIESEGKKIGVKKEELRFPRTFIYFPYDEDGFKKFVNKSNEGLFQIIENVELKEVQLTLKAKELIKLKAKELNEELKEEMEEEKFTLKAHMKELFIKFKLSPRQINQFFRIYLSLLIHEKSTSSLGYQIASIIYLAIDLHNLEIAKKILNNKFTYSDILNLLESKGVDLTDHMALNLLFLFSNNQNQISNNFEIYKSKFGQNNIDLMSRKYDLFISHSDIETFFVMQNVGKKISQSKNFFS